MPKSCDLPRVCVFVCVYVCVCVCVCVCAHMMNYVSRITHKCESRVNTHVDMSGCASDGKEFNSHCHDWML